MNEQGKLLAEVAWLVDTGTVQTTMTERLSPIDAEALRGVHARLESGTTRGKIVLQGFGGMPPIAA